MVDLIVSDVPEPVLARLAHDAENRDVSLNDAAVEILSAARRMAHEPSGARFRSAPSTGRLLLALPDDLHRRIKMDAAARPGVTMRGLVIEALANHYGVPVPAPQRRPRGTAT